MPDRRPPDVPGAVALFFSLNFVVDKSGLVTALPGAVAEVASVTGIGFDNFP